MKVKKMAYPAMAGFVALTMLVGCSRPTDNGNDTSPESDGSNQSEQATNADGAGSSDVIRLGVPGVYSGPSASAGNGILEGLEVKANEINEEGGLLDGQMIELVTREHGTDPDVAIDNIRELIDNDNITAFVGGSTTGRILATAPIVNEAGIPRVVARGTGTKATEQPDPNYIFRVSLVDNLQTQFAAAEALERTDKVALLTDTSGLGQGGREDLMAAFDELGTAPVADETFNVGDTDMTSQLSRVQDAGAEVIIFWGVGPEAAQVRQGMDSLSMDQLMIANWGLGMPNYPELAGDLADGTLVIQTVTFYETTDPIAEDALARFEEEFDTDRLTFAQE